MSHPHPLTNKYFQLYCKFFNIDIETAILEGRSFDIIDLFRMNLALLLDADVEYKAVKESLEALELVIDEEMRTYNQLKLYDETKITWSSARYEYEQSQTYFINFIESYDFTFDALNLDVTDRKVQDLLVEFNNALSHLLSSFFQSVDEIRNSNIKKTNTHLYRGVLDSYKEVIHKNHDILRVNSNSVSNLNNDTFLDFYLKLRQFEATTIGIDEDGKNKLLSDYRLLAWSLVN